MSSIEAKRVQYRKYLERSGVIDALSKALIKLYEERNTPDDAIRFMRKVMCDTCPDDAQFDVMKNDLQAALKKVVKLEQDLDRCKSLIKKTPKEIAELLETGVRSLIEDEDKTGSLLRKYLTEEILNEYISTFTSPPVEASLLDCVQSGFAHHDSSCGIYAANAESYDVFNKLFDPIIRDYNGQWENKNEQLQPDTDFGEMDDIENLDAESKYIISTRIRIARNIEGFPYFAKLSEKEFLKIEDHVKAAAEAMEGELAGAYFSMKNIADDLQMELVKRHVLFKKGDRFLKDAGCYRFWPLGRGIYHNPAYTFMIWVNEEDHLRIISMSSCGDLGDAYTRLVKGLKELEKNLNFSRHPLYGNLTACPTNLGTTMRCSVHIRLPLLSKDQARLKTMAKDLSLQIRGTGGEHTKIEDGVMDISNRRRLGLTEYDVVKTLQEGIITLIKAEQELELTQ